MDTPPVRYHDVITGVSPLESVYRGVHPRMHFNGARRDDLRARIDQAPYANWLARIRATVETIAETPCPVDAEAQGDLRGKGQHVSAMAFVYLMTGERKFFDGARNHLLTIADWSDDKWRAALLGGHLQYGCGLAYDWLFHELAPAERKHIRQALYRHAKWWVAEYGLHLNIVADGYGWNHSAVDICGVTAAACAIYGDIEDDEGDEVGPWLKLVIQHHRLTTACLGADGVSPEGITYGEYFAEYYLNAIDLVAGLLGEDFFKDNHWLQNYPKHTLHASLPRERWNRQYSLINFGDGPRYHWYGPGNMLRKTASRYGIGVSQTLADLADEDEIGPVQFTDLVWYDPEAPRTPIASEPLFAHFDDKDLAFMRSDWTGDASIFAFKCGPPSGHHALQNYTSDIGGGHMHPDAGTIQLFARGDMLLADDGYTHKMTDYQNTLLVDGVGQHGEDSEWFESTPTRRDRRAARILHAASSAKVDYVIGDATEAYPIDGPLTCFLRHVVYLRPNLWVLIDEIDAARPSTFSWRFHGDFPFELDDAGLSCIARGNQATMRMSFSPSFDSLNAVSEVHDMRGTSVQKNVSMPCVRLAAPSPLSSATLITVIEVIENAAAFGDAPTYADHTLTAGGHTLQLKLRQTDRSQPVIDI